MASTAASIFAPISLPTTATAITGDLPMSPLTADLTSLLPAGRSLAVWIPWALGLALLIGVLSLVLLPSARAWAADFRAWRRARRKDHWMSTGRQMMENGDHDEALRCFEQVTEDFPQNLEAWHALACCFEDAQRFEQAAKTYIEAHERTAGGEPGFLASAARCALHAGEEGWAIELLVEVNEMSPSTVRRMLENEAYADLLKDDRLHQCTETTPRPASEPDIV